MARIFRDNSHLMVRDSPNINADTIREIFASSTASSGSSDITGEAPKLNKPLATKLRVTELVIFNISGWFVIITLPPLA
jgi:hypothetical protein